MVDAGRGKHKLVILHAMERAGILSTVVYLDQVVRGQTLYDRFLVTLLYSSADDTLHAAQSALARQCDNVQTMKSDSTLCALVDHRRYDTRILPLDLTNTQVAILISLLCAALLLLAAAFANDSTLWCLADMLFHSRSGFEPLRE